MMYLELPEKTDDAIMQQRDAAEWQESLYQEFIRRTGMAEDAAARLSDSTMHQVLIELDEANDEYESWADSTATPEPFGVIVGNVYALPLDDCPF